MIGGDIVYALLHIGLNAMASVLVQNIVWKILAIIAHKQQKLLYISIAYNKSTQTAVEKSMSVFLGDFYFTSSLTIDINPFKPYMEKIWIIDF